jgi:hypothetical protein
MARSVPLAKKANYESRVAKSVRDILTLPLTPKPLTRTAGFALVI